MCLSFPYPLLVWSRHVECKYRAAREFSLYYYYEEGERDKAHDDDDRGNALSVGKGKNGSTIFFMKFTADH